MCWARWMVALHLTTSLLVPAVCMHALLPDYCHCYRESAGHVMPADKHNLPSMRGEPDHHDSSINNKRQCQRRLLSPHICITPHAVDRDFQARKQESVTLAWAKSKADSGARSSAHRRVAVTIPSRNNNNTVQLVYYCCYRSDARKLSASCRVTRLPVLVHARARALMRVTVSSDRRAGGPNHSQVVAITHSCSHRRTMMLQEGQSGSTAFLSVAGQSRERGGASVLMILLLLNYYQLATTTAIVFTAFLPARWTGYEEDRNVAWVGGSQGNGGIVLCVISCPHRLVLTDATDDNALQGVI
jgi:hypothetical protein